MESIQSTDIMEDRVPSAGDDLFLDTCQKVGQYHQQAQEYLDRIDRSLVIINTRFQETIESLQESIDALKKMFPEEFTESQDELR